MKSALVSAAIFFSTLHQAQAVSQSIIPNSADASQNRINQCARIHSLNLTFCECAESVSQKLSEKDPIFQFFIDSSEKNKAEIVNIYEVLVDGTSYKSHNFSSRKQKMEYIEGKYQLFARRLNSECK